MADVNNLITLGIGATSSVEHFILVGLNAGDSPPPPEVDVDNSAFTGMSGMSSTDDFEAS